MNRLGIALILCAWCAALPYAQSNPVVSPSASQGPIKILRDPWGVPHIFADTDESAFYGLGYSCAEDRAFQMYYNLRIIQGRSAELLGDSPNSNRLDQTPLGNDIKVRTEGFYRAAQRLIPTLDAESVSFLQAYSDGVNEFIAQHPDQLIDLFQKLNLKIEPWTPADCIASWWHLGNFFSTEGLNDAMTYYRILDGAPNPIDRGGRGINQALLERANRANHAAPDDTAAVIQQSDVSNTWIKQVNQFVEKFGLRAKNFPIQDGPKFSHAWVVGKEKITTKSSVLCSDPQTPVRNPSLFYEFHFCGKTFNARGIGVPGSPVILIGWTPYVAWGATALGADQSDLFLLQTNPDHPNQYFYDGQWRDMTVTKETIQVKGSKPIEIEVKETQRGPVVTSIAKGLKPGDQVAQQRIPLCEKGIETIQGAIAMMRAKNVQEFSQALHGWRFPSLNSVYGDKEGNIGYCALAAIPIRSRYALQQGDAAHPGNDSKYDWQGIVPYDLLPQVINPQRGYIYSANHRPIQSFYKIPIGISTGSLGDTVRSWRLGEKLKEQESFTPEEVLQVHYDTVNPARRELLEIAYHLRDVQKANLSPDTQSALHYLQKWYEGGAKSDNNLAGTELALCIPLMFRIATTELAATYGGGESGLTRFLKNAQQRIQKNPGVEFSDPERTYIDQTLSQAWNFAMDQYGPDPEFWQTLASEQIEKKRIGYMDSLDGLGSLDQDLDILQPFLTDTDGGTIHSQASGSYSQWVPLNDIDQACSLLPIGNSENPKSPYRLCTLQLWGKGELHPAPLSQSAVEKIAEKKIILSACTRTQ